MNARRMQEDVKPRARMMVCLVLEMEHLADRNNAKSNNKMVGLFILSLIYPFFLQNFVRFEASQNAALKTRKREKEREKVPEPTT